MRSFSFLISKYVLQAVLPYFLFTWLLLSVILFVQQAGRYSDLLFNTSLPTSLLWQLTIALVPNVIAFTCPVAALVGVIIGLSRMQGDSEMTAVRAAGVGNFQISIPMIFLGVFLSLFAFFINLKGVPFAAQIVRQVALKAALYKLESPIEPGTFNSEINDLTIYVNKGNIEKGTWENIFIHQDDKKNKQERLITSSEGKIDTSGEDTEIFLKNAYVTTFENNNENKVISENVRDFRLVVQTKRGELIEKLGKTNETPEEMGLFELARHIKTLKGNDKTEAQILLQRRILLSITPILFALLGTALVAKFSRGGRGFGILLSLVSLVIYYLLTLLGEQLARTGSIQVITAGLIPFISSILAIFWFYFSGRFFITRNLSIKHFFEREEQNISENKIASKNSYIDLTTGILDLDLIWNLVKYYVLTLAFLIAIFLIFTAFELWKFAGTFENGVQLLVTYLFYLIPFVYIQIAPSALMVATLTTYIIKSRQNEIVTWTAAGQSVYRLLLPCFILMILIGGMNFGFQEFVLTEANRMQDTLRDRIRNRNKVTKKDGKFWIVEDNKIYNFEKTNASDNDSGVIENLKIYEFNKQKEKIISQISVKEALWQENGIQFLKKAEKKIWENEILSKRLMPEGFYETKINHFQNLVTKPNHLNISETKNKIKKADFLTEKINYSISLQKKYATLFIPLIVILFTAPFALSLGRKGNVITIGYAIAVWLLFMGTTNVFEQFGQSGYLTPVLAIWSPLILFTIIGLYLLTKIKT